MPQSKEVHRDYMRGRRKGSQDEVHKVGFTGQGSQGFYRGYCQERGIEVTQELKPINPEEDGIIVSSQGHLFYKREWVR